MPSLLRPPAASAPTNFIYLALFTRFCWRWSTCCEFPAFLQTTLDPDIRSGTMTLTGNGNLTQTKVNENRKRSGWRGRIEEQNTKYEFNMAAEKNLLRFTNPGDNTIQRSLICLKVFDGDKYLVGQTDRGT